MDDHKARMIAGTLLAAKNLKGKFLKSLIINNRFYALVKHENKIKIFQSMELTHICSDCKTWDIAKWTRSITQGIYNNIQKALDYIKQ
jgi:hypothetical protein